MEGDDVLTSAVCNVCGKRLTKLEFKACHGGHFCDKHRKPPLPIQKPSKKPVTSKPPDGGNVAFKVTWVYGAGGPFTTPCTPEGRDINIRIAKKIWCCQATCPCKQLHGAKNNDPYDRDSMKYPPCYDVAIFDKWSFGGGTYHSKKRRGAPIPFKNFQMGKLAFFTSCRHDMTEKERIIIGCYRIAKAITDPDFDDTLVAAAGDYKLKVVNLDEAPKYWDFHRQSGGPMWGMGLFRYLPDEEAEAMLEAVKKVAVEVK